MKTTPSLCWLLMVGLAALLIGCGDEKTEKDPVDTRDLGRKDASDMLDAETDGVDPDVETDVAPIETGSVRVMHLSPDAPAVDVYVNGQSPAAITDIAFTTGTPYSTMDVGTYDLDVAPIGTSLDDAVLSVSGFVVETDTSYTVVAIDNLATISALTLVDDMTDIASGDVRLRFVHAAAGIGQVDVWDLTDPMTPAVLDADVDFGGAGTAVDRPAGAYTLGLDLDEDMVPDATFAMPMGSADQSVNLFATSEDGLSVFLVAQYGDGTTERIDPSPIVPPDMADIRALHLSPDAPPDLDVFFNDGAMPSIFNLLYGQSSVYVATAIGDIKVDFAATGDPVANTILTLPPLTVAADLDYTVVAFDKLANIQALVLQDDSSVPTVGSARIRLTHAAADVGPVDVLEIPAMGAPTALTSDLDLGATGTAVELLAGIHTVGLDVDNDVMPEFTFTLPDLMDGDIADIYAVSEDAMTVYLVVHFADGATMQIDPN